MVFPASTNGGGQCMTTGPIDVCKTPAAPSPIPLPYPNIAMLMQAKGSSCSSKVKIGNKKGCTQKTVVGSMQTTGDDAGVVGGLVSGKFKDEMAYKTSMSKVKYQGQKATHLCCMTSHNKNNAPAGINLSPGQTMTVV